VTRQEFADHQAAMIAAAGLLADPDALAVLRERIALEIARLWRNSQADQCRIREAGIMQDHADRLSAALAATPTDPKENR
jgi:hypothetical protein